MFTNIFFAITPDALHQLYQGVVTTTGCPQEHSPGYLSSSFPPSTSSENPIASYLVLSSAFPPGAVSHRPASSFPHGHCSISCATRLSHPHKRHLEASRRHSTAVPCKNERLPRPRHPRTLQVTETSFPRPLPSVD